MRPYTVQKLYAPYFITWTVVEWIDVFTRQRYRDILLDSWRYCTHHKGLMIHGFVIMSNHVHLITSTREGYNLSDCIRDCKKYSSKQILQSILDDTESRRSWMLSRFLMHGNMNPNNDRYQLWQNGYHAVDVSDLRRCYQRLQYIHNNPVKAGIVKLPEHYLYSSARNYAHLPAVMDVSLIDIIPLDGYLPPL